MVKDRRYYDFELNVDVLSRTRGTFGVIFRVLNPFNFYAYIINIKRGYKQIFRVKNGRYHLIKHRKDGGLSQNMWYRIQITGIKDLFVVKTGEAFRFNYKNIPVMFEFKDNEFNFGQ